MMLRHTVRQNYRTKNAVGSAAFPLAAGPAPARRLLFGENDQTVIFPVLAILGGNVIRAGRAAINEDFLADPFGL
jgi:hypothetical protein